MGTQNATISTAENTKDALLEGGIPNWMEITEGGRILLRSSKLAQVMHVSEKALPKWEAAGCPKEKRGFWDVAAVIKWRGRAVGVQGGPTAEADKLAADTKLKQTRAELEAIKLKSMTGEYMPIALIEERVTKIFANIRQSLLSIGERLLSQTYVMYPELAQEAKRMIDNEIRQALKELAAKGIYEPPPKRNMAGRPKRKAKPKS